MGKRKLFAAYNPGTILVIGSANELKRYYVIPTPIDRAHTPNEPCNHQQHFSCQKQITLILNTVRFSKYPEVEKLVVF